MTSGKGMTSAVNHRVRRVKPLSASPDKGGLKRVTTGERRVGAGIPL